MSRIRIKIYKITINKIIIDLSPCKRYNDDIPSGGDILENKDIRAAIATAGLKMWQVADGLGIADTTFCRKLRHELPIEEKELVYAVIRELSGEVVQ